MTTARAILAIDQGTTNTKVVVFDALGRIVARASRPNVVAHPQPAWAEQSAIEVWEGVREAIAEAVESIGDRFDICGVAISNQRESVVVWDAITGEPVGPSILWQCRRTSARCQALRAQKLEPQIVARSGLGLDALFSATKIAWLLDSRPGLRARAERGDLRAGTMDAWLIWKLTGGVHATDLSNASRTQLLNLDSLTWDPWLADAFQVPLAILPQIRPSNAVFGETRDGATRLRAGLPILAVMGDSHAALYGHSITGVGEVKVTCGTGSSLISVTDRRVSSSNGLSSTIAWQKGDTAFHALEGNISVSGQTAALTAALLGLEDAEALTRLAQTVPDADGIVLVPAFAGLGAPHWKEDARGTISGMTLGSRPAHVARAALDAIALQIVDVLKAMESDLGQSFPVIAVDGGASANDMLMQLLADLSGCPVRRGTIVELSAFGVARLAAESLGLRWASGSTDNAVVFTSAMAPDTRQRISSRWRQAVTRASITIPLEPL
ncbi:FGGY family carbohydrate kinase [Brevundimonas sp.]|jgi:glycerol kinase|uniref:FGGY family carbohydrate kinase n=1 Tax=Brevundimonas sp. TaxID=1871086 RepID=UPI0037850201